MTNSTLLQPHLLPCPPDTLANLSQAAGPEQISLLDTLILGGWIMIPIFLLSFVAIYLFVERLVTIRKAKTDPEALTRRVRDYVQGGDVKGAMGYCESRDKPVARILRHGLERLGRPISEIQDAVQAQGKHEPSSWRNAPNFLRALQALRRCLAFSER